MKQEHLQFRLNCGAMDLGTPVKEEPIAHSPHIHRTYSPSVFQGFTDSPSVIKKETFTPDKMTHSDDLYSLSQRLPLHADTHSSIHTDALVDIVLQVSICLVEMKSCTEHKYLALINGILKINI